MSLKDYYQKLESHDWYYDYSDDYTVWSRGHRIHQQLKEISKLSKEHEQLYKEFVDYIFHGGNDPRLEE